jgi:hypothetical protein
LEGKLDKPPRLQTAPSDAVDELVVEQALDKAGMLNERLRRAA